MSAQYEPGTVAVITVPGRSGVRAMRGQDVWATCEKGTQFGGSQDLWHDSDVTDVRLLAVLDPASVVDQNRLTFAWESYGGHAGLILSSLAHPTHPPEPKGLGAVVRDRSLGACAVAGWRYP